MAVLGSKPGEVALQGVADAGGVAQLEGRQPPCCTSPTHLAQPSLQRGRGKQPYTPEPPPTTNPDLDLNPNPYPGRWRSWKAARRCGANRGGVASPAPGVPMTALTCASAARCAAT